MMHCEASVTYGGAGKSHQCHFKAKYLATRTSDRDQMIVCGSHLNQLLRIGGWTFKAVEKR